jgi:tetratricopeptide (TPR) repeat protein
MSRLLRRLTIFLCVTLTTASVHAQQQRVEELRFPAGAIVGFHLTEPYLSCAVGTRFKVKISVPIDPKVSKFGDAVDGTLASPFICNNAPILPAGTAITGSFVLIGGEAASQADSFGIELTFVNARPGNRSIHAKMDSKQLFAASHAATRQPAVNQRAENHRKAALAQLKSGNVEGAIAELRSAIKLDDANPSYHVSLGDALLKKRDFNGVLTEWQRGFQLVRGPTSAQHQAIGRLLLKRGDVDGSIQEFQSAAQLEPDNVQNREALAAAYARKGDAEAEIAQYREIAREKPNDLGNHKRLAVALLKQKDYADAKVEFKIVLRLAPNNAGAYTGLGAADAALGNSMDAASELRQALSIDPQNAFAQGKLNAISRLQAKQEEQQQAQSPPQDSNSGSECDPNWSPKFNDINVLGFENSPESVKQKTDEQVANFGGVAGATAEANREKEILEQQLAQAQNADDDDAANKWGQMVQFMDGMLDVLQCRAGTSAEQASSSPEPAAAPLATYTPGGDNSSSGTGNRVYTPGSSSDDDSDNSGAYTPGSPANSPANDTSLGMLDTSSNLKQAYVGITSDYSTLTDQNQSSCDATVHVTLLSSQPSGSGATLQFQASVQPNAGLPSVPAGCLDLEYTIWAIQRMSNGDSGPPAGKTFDTKFADASDTVTIELPVASTGSNDIDLVGWHVSGALCHAGGQCVAHVSPEECSQLEDYQTNELPNQIMALIKAYGITALNRDAAASLQSDLSPEVSDASFAIFMDDLKMIADETQDLAFLFAPEGKLANLAVELGPKPSLTARDVWTHIIEPQQNLHGATEAIKQALDDDYKGLLVSLGAKLSPVVALCKNVSSAAKDVYNLKSVSAELVDQINALQAAIDDYNNTLQIIMDQVNEIQQVSQGIDMACGGGTSNNANQ